MHLGGRSQLRKIYKRYYALANALVICIDSSDTTRLEETQSEIRRAIEEEELHDVPILVLANKCDLPTALKHTELSEKLDLESCLQGRVWRTDFVDAFRATF